MHDDRERENREPQPGNRHKPPGQDRTSDSVSSGAEVAQEVDDATDEALSKQQGAPLEEQ
jgi:hypothetical protein